MIREQNLPSLRTVFFFVSLLILYVCMYCYNYITIIVSTVVEIDVRDRNRSLSTKITETSLSYYIPARETLVFYCFFSPSFCHILPRIEFSQVLHIKIHVCMYRN